MAVYRGSFKSYTPFNWEPTELF